MKRCVEKIRTWHAQREQRSFERWHRQRVRGKTRFILHTTLTYVALVVLTTDVFDYLYDGKMQAMDFWGTTTWYFYAGLFVASGSWENKEDKYYQRLRGKA